MELVLKVNSTSGDQSHYQDGDVIEAFSSTRIQFCHADMICHPNNFGFNSAGLRDRDTLLEKFMAKTSKYRFTRVNSTDVERLNLLTDVTDVVNDTPNADGEYMDVELFISRRITSLRHKVFGSELGQEVWYGDNAARDSVTSDAVWDEIETHSDYLKDDHANWPLSDIEKSTCLAVNCVGFKDSTVREVSSGTASSRRGSVTNQVDDPDQPGEVLDEIVAKRQWQVPYWDLSSELGIEVDDVRDRNKPVDARSSAPLEDRSHLDDINVDKIVAGIITL